MDSNHRSLAKSRGFRQVNILQILAGRLSGYPTVGRCGDVRFRALVKGSMAWLLCLAVGQASSLASSCCSTLFFAHPAFRRGTNGSNPVPSSGESPANLSFRRIEVPGRSREADGEQRELGEARTFVRVRRRRAQGGLRRSRVFGQVPGRNKLKAGSRLLVSPFPEIKFILSCCGVL